MYYSLFLNNSYNTSVAGSGTHGTVRIEGCSDLNVLNSKFDNNHAWTGSALWITGNKINIDSCIFIKHIYH